MDRRKPTPQDILNWFGGGVAMGLVIVLGFVTFALIYEEVPTNNQNALLVLIGILSTNITQVINFFFGSSAQTKKQQDTIDTLARTAQSAQSASAPKADTVVIPEGGTATVSATPEGASITPDRPKP